MGQIITRKQNAPNARANMVEMQQPTSKQRSYNIQHTNSKKGSKSVVRSQVHRLLSVAALVGAVDAEFERDRVGQLKHWRTMREFFAASRNLLDVMVKFEEMKNELGDFDQRFPGEYYLRHRDNVGATVLHVAILCDATDIVKYLINKYSYVNRLGSATRASGVDPSQSIVNAPYHIIGKDFGSPFEGETPLHLAIVKGDLEIVRLLVQNGADVNAEAIGKFFDKNTTEDSGVYFGAFPLSFAVCVGNSHMVEYLLDHGAKMSSPDEYGNTALHMAVWYERPEIYDILVDRDETGLERMFNHDHFTPLQLAAERASMKMFEHILQKHRQVGWSFGPLTEFLYPIDGIDTFQSVDSGSEQTEGALELCVKQGTFNHGRLLEVSPMKELLLEKWHKFAKKLFLCFLGLYMFIAIVMTVIINVQPDDLNDYSGTEGNIRLVAELVVFGIVMLDSMFLEGTDLVWALFCPSSGYGALLLRSMIFVLVSWGFRVSLFLCFMLRVFDVSQEAQKSVMSGMIVLAWFYVLNLSRGFKMIGRFLKFVEGISIELIKWSVAYSITLLGFSCGFFIIFGGESKNFKHLGITMFTLLKYTIGEVDFSEYEESVNRQFAFVLFVSFVMLVSVIMFSLLIAVMTAQHDRLKREANVYAELSWAASIIIVERRLFLQSWRDNFRSGISAEQAGLVSTEKEYYKPVIMKDLDNAQGIDWKALEVSKFPRMALASSVQHKVFERFFQSPLAKHEGVLQPFIKILDILRAYDPRDTHVVSRDCVVFILEDIFALSPGDGIINPVELRNQIDVLSKALDGEDMDDEIAVETLFTFIRLWRASLSPHNDVKSALIIVDMQNDYIESSATTCKGAKDLIPKINRMRNEIDKSGKKFDLVVTTQDWHPVDHAGFDRVSETRKAVLAQKKKVHEIRIQEGYDMETLQRAEERLSDLKEMLEDYEAESSAAKQIWDWEHRLPPHCIQGTEGAALTEKLRVDESDIRIMKGTARDSYSYSAFWNDNRMTETRLFCELFDRNIDQVFICGVGYDRAVGRTARDARIFGFPTHVISDCVKWFNDMEKHETDLQLANLDVNAEAVSTNLLPMLHQIKDLKTDISTLANVKRLNKRFRNSTLSSYK